MPEADIERDILQKAKVQPMLAPGEAALLSAAWRERGDRKARDRMAASHLRLVAKIAQGFKRYGLPFEDLYGAGAEGLLLAIDRFDGSRGFKLSTYATWWIEARIQDMILREYSLVRLGATADQKKLFFKLKQTKQRLCIPDAAAMSDEDARLVCEALGVKNIADVKSMDVRTSGRDLPLDVPLCSGDSEGETHLDAIPDTAALTEDDHIEAAELLRSRPHLMAALRELPERERSIIVDRRLMETPKPLKEIAEQWGVSRQRVSEIERKAMEKLTLLAQQYADIDQLERLLGSAPQAN